MEALLGQPVGGILRGSQTGRLTCLYSPKSKYFKSNSAARASAQPLEKRREHDQLTFIASDEMEVREAFEKNNACTQEGFVNALLGIIDRAG